MTYVGCRNPRRLSQPGGFWVRSDVSELLLIRQRQTYESIDLMYAAISATANYVRDGEITSMVCDILAQAVIVY